MLWLTIAAILLLTAACVIAVREQENQLADDVIGNNTATSSGWRTGGFVRTVTVLPPTLQIKPLEMLKWKTIWLIF